MKKNSVLKYGIQSFAKKLQKNGVESNTVPGSMNLILRVIETQHEVKVHMRTCLSFCNGKPLKQMCLHPIFYEIGKVFLSIQPKWRSSLRQKLRLNALRKFQGPFLKIGNEKASWPFYNLHLKINGLGTSESSDLFILNWRLKFHFWCFYFLRGRHNASPTSSKYGKFRNRPAEMLIRLL